MLRLLPWTLAHLALALSGCLGGDDVGGDGSATTGSSDAGTFGDSSTSVGPGTATRSATTDVETTSVETATTGTASTAMTDASGTTSSSTTASTGTTTGGDACVEPPFDPDPVGAGGGMCSKDDECANGWKCYVLPLVGGLCGECLVDADCPDGGCTPPNPLAGVGAVCNTGKPGAGCETDEVCDNTCNNVCGVAFDATQIIKVSTCGACRTDDDCANGAICAPEVDFGGFSGINHCVPPGSVAHGDTCSLTAGGGEACASGKCATATIMGIVNIGVCGECLGPEDCAPGQVCTDAYIVPETSEFIGSICE